VAAYCYAHWAVLFASFDGGLFAVAFLILSLLVYSVIGTVLLRLILTWLAIRGLLRNLYWHPSRRFYATLHEGLPGGEDSMIDMLSADPAIIALEVSLEQAGCSGAVLSRNPQFLWLVRAMWERGWRRMVI